MNVVLLVGDCGCQADACFVEDEGTVTSPFYPSDYPANIAVTALITAPTGQTVTITFGDDFETESSTTCAFDFLTLYDGATSSDTEIGTYCGTTGPGCITSSSENLLIYFESDGSREEKGFTSSYNFDGKMHAAVVVFVFLCLFNCLFLLWRL